MSRKSARVAAKPAKKAEPEDDLNGEEEEEEEEKPKRKRAAPKSPGKGKGKKKVEDDDEEAEGEDDEEGGGSKKAKTSHMDSSNALTNLATCLEAAKGSKTLKEILTITPSTITTTTTTTTVDPVDGSSSTTVTSLKELAPSGFEPHFDEIANALLNRSIFFIGGLPHRVLELEFYCNGHQHIDLFAHGHERQKKRAEWYFHMTGKGYKGGSYKGLDVTFGDDEFYGGILLRTIQPLYGDFAPIEGPSLLVDHVLRTTNSSGIEELVSGFDLTAELKSPEKTDHPLFFVHFDLDKEIPAIKSGTVYKGARVGLSMKTFQDGKETYVGKFYRYMIDPEKIKKGRHYFVVSLHQQGYTPQQIVDVSKSTPAMVKKLIGLFNKGGESKNFKQFCNKNIKNDEVCEMLGACSAFSYPK